MIKKYYFTGLGNFFDGYGLYVKNNDVVTLNAVLGLRYGRNNYSTKNTLTKSPYYGQRWEEEIAIGPSSTISGYLDYRNELTGYVDPNALEVSYKNNNDDSGAMFVFERYFPPTFTAEGKTYYFSRNTFYDYIHESVHKLTVFDLLSTSFSYSYSFNVDEILDDYGQNLSASIVPSTGILSAWVPLYNRLYEDEIMRPITDFTLEGNEKFYECTYNDRHGVDVYWRPVTRFLS